MGRSGLIMGLNENIIRSAVSVALQAVDGRNDLSIIHIHAGKDGDVNVMYEISMMAVNTVFMIY